MLKYSSSLSEAEKDSTSRTLSELEMEVAWLLVRLSHQQQLEYKHGDGRDQGRSKKNGRLEEEEEEEEEGVAGIIEDVFEEEYGHPKRRNMRIRPVDQIYSSTQPLVPVNDAAKRLRIHQ